MCRSFCARGNLRLLIWLSWSISFKLEGKCRYPANSSAFIKSYCTSIRCINYGSSDKKEIARFESCGSSLGIPFSYIDRLFALRSTLALTDSSKIAEPSFTAISLAKPILAARRKIPITHEMAWACSEANVGESGVIVWGLGIGNNKKRSFSESSIPTVESKA